MLTNNEIKQVKQKHNDAKARSVSSPKIINRTVADNETSTIEKEVVPMKHNDGDQDDVTIERNARHDFDSSVAVRAEFENVDRYIAFCKAEARGSIKILGGVVRGGK